MTYAPFLISNYATGLDRELQPWLLPNDAFTDLLDGFVFICSKFPFCRFGATLLHPPWPEIIP